MGNLIRGCDGKTCSSVPQEKCECNNIQEEFFQAIRDNDICTLESLLHCRLDATKGNSAIPTVLVTEQEADKILNCPQYFHVDPETSGKKKRRFYCQISNISAGQENACCFWNINQRPDQSNKEVWVSQSDLRTRLEACSHINANILHKCIHFKTIHLVPFILCDELDIDAMDASGLTGLHLASKNLKIQSIQVLLYCGANVNLTHPETGKSALHFATQSSSSKGSVMLAAGAECVGLLLHNGANACMRDKKGVEAIHFACRCGRKDLVTLLLDHGADINSLTSHQESPLFLFLEEKRNLRKTQLLDKLLSLSYPLKLTNSKGCLPKGLLFPHARQLKDTLLRMSSDVLPLQEICKFNIRKIYGEKMKWWLQKKLPTMLWNSIYVFQEFSYVSKIKLFN